MMKPRLARGCLPASGRIEIRIRLVTGLVAGRIHGRWPTVSRSSANAGADTCSTS
jgi:hypothetical protein